MMCTWPCRPHTAPALGDTTTIRSSLSTTSPAGIPGVAKDNTWYTVGDYISVAMSDVWPMAAETSYCPLDVLPGLKSRGFPLAAYAAVGVLPVSTPTAATSCGLTRARKRCDLQSRDRQRGRVSDQEVDVVGFTVELD